VEPSRSAARVLSRAATALGPRRGAGTGPSSHVGQRLPEIRGARSKGRPARTVASRVRAGCSSGSTGTPCPRRTTSCSRRRDSVAWSPRSASAPPAGS